MTDKQLKRANEIKSDLRNLEWLKGEFSKGGIVQFNMNPLQMIKSDLIDVVEGKIAQLRAEYKSL